ncbi:hypothetical protein QTP70_022842 [Hemibagrus guttatus]|uniref:Uncharacterized protein n=1 Tax=Hemibagrus guttatus TaxID=175788 RepID=A0AAE0ULR2_9TELE|nr:hypothetical protein QTP70_022842 [Hemibagrus guttatus]
MTNPCAGGGTYCNTDAKRRTPKQNGSRRRNNRDLKRVSALCVR